MAAFAVYLAILTLCIYTTLPSIDASKGGFSVELINRDSPKSPFYNPDETPHLRLANSIRRSIHRAHRFSSKSSTVSPDSAQSVVIANLGEYLMKISLGTPAFDILAIADTGSDLIWTQCEPCEQCYKQDAPLFDPKKSTTYRDVSCNSNQCAILERTLCSQTGTCDYSYSYGDSSSTIGNLAVEALSLGSTDGRPVSIPKAVFGCGHKNGGTFSEKGSGIVGLGGGPVSLISQLGSRISGKFSYCLVPILSRTKNSSKLNFGSEGIVSGSGVQSTPLIPKDPNTFYYLTLEAISVGNRTIIFRDSGLGTSEGNIIIDSGTTLTLLPTGFFSELAGEVERVVRGTRVEDPNGLLSLCYKAEPGLRVPTITVHFHGAHIELSQLNTFIQVSDTVVCFSFHPIDNGAIYGNLAQMNFLVGYDLEGKTVSFKPTDCTQ